MERTALARAPFSTWWMVAGLLTTNAGEITYSGESLFDSGLRINLPPEERKIGYVFQNYALFPHRER